MLVKDAIIEIGKLKNNFNRRFKGDKHRLTQIFLVYFLIIIKPEFIC